MDYRLNGCMLGLMVAEIHNSREKHGEEGGNAQKEYVNNHVWLCLTIQKCAKHVPQALKMKAVKHRSKFYGHIGRGCAQDALKKAFYGGGKILYLHALVIFKYAF